MIGDLTALTVTVAALLVRAKVFAEPPAIATQRLLGLHEAEERKKLKTAAPEPDRTTLDRAIEAARQRIAMVDDLDGRIRSLSERIGPLVTAQRARGRSRWSHWFRAAAEDERLDGLRAERARLQEERRLAAVPLNIALRQLDRAEDAFALSKAEIERAHERTLERSEGRIAAIARARRLVEAWPAFVHMGIRWIIGAGNRVNRAKDRGWDPGPSAGPTSP